MRISSLIWLSIYRIELNEEEEEEKKLTSLSLQK